MMKVSIYSTIEKERKKRERGEMPVTVIRRWRCEVPLSGGWILVVNWAKGLCVSLRDHSSHYLQMRPGLNQRRSASWGFEFHGERRGS